MSPRQIELLCDSWKDAEPIADTVVRLFYRRLFQQAPELRGKFRTSMSEQGDRLYAVVDCLVHALELGVEPASTPTPASMKQYGEVVAKAWTWTLRQELGRKAPLEARKAWRSLLKRPEATQLYAVAMGELELAA